MNTPHLLEAMTKNKMLMYFGIAIIGIVVISITTVFPIWNLFPKYVTEQVKIVSVDKNGCVAQTQDNFLVNMGKCNANPGDVITATYDANIAMRARAFLP